MNKTIMYELSQTYTEFPKISNTFIYDLLSNIINKIANMLAQAYKLNSQSFQDQFYLKVQSINQLELTADNFYNKQSINIEEDLKNIELTQLIKKRLINRLIEIILPYKQVCLQIGHLKPLRGLLSQLQHSAASFYENQCLSQFTISVKDHFKAYTTILKVLNNLEQPHQGLQPEKQKKERSKKYIKTIKTEYESQASKKYKKILTILNKQFKKLSSLNLDYAYFRNSYFEVTKNNELYPEFLERNALIKANIRNYQQQYNAYQKRKQLKNIRKKFSLNNENQLRRTQRKFNQTKILSKKTRTKIDEKSINRLQITQKTLKLQKYNKQTISYNRRNTDGQAIKNSLKGNDVFRKKQITIKNIILKTDQYHMEPIKIIKFNAFNPKKQSLQNYRKKTNNKKKSISFITDIRNLTKRMDSI